MHFRHKFEAKIQAVQVIVVGMDVIPDFGDLYGLTRLCWLAFQRIRASDMSEEEKVAIIGMIEEEYRAARAGYLT